MEHRRDFGRRIGLLWFALSLFVLPPNTRAENKTDPTANVNLSPFQQWRSAHFCVVQFQNRTSCGNFLTEGDGLKVDKNNPSELCDSSCLQHTRDVITCIYYCKRDYSFANNKTILEVNQTLYEHCPHVSG